MTDRNSPSPLRRTLKRLALPGAAAVVLCGGGVLVLWRPWSGATAPGGLSAVEPAIEAASGPVEPAPRPTEVVAFSDGCATAACHASYLLSERVHGPVAEGACETCHEPDAGGHVYPVVAGVEQGCAQCHDIGADHQFRHAAMSAEGCLACHDPHVSDAPALLTAGSIGATCDACHPATGGTVVHAPYAAGECTSCHDPHAEDNALLLHGGTGGDHCALCHSDTFGATEREGHPHAELEADCMRCHAAHASDWPSMLVGNASDQCVRCHESIREVIATSLVTHRGAMADRQCVACHLPHASRESAMLRDDQASVCLSCHDEEVEAIDGRTIPDMTPLVRDADYRHGPVDHGQCGLCHSVHGSAYPKLLRGENPDIMLGSFDARHYSLCFSCHDPALVEEAESTSVTAFRDGARNLHSLHVVNGGTARSCSTCHVIHGGSRPRLVADLVSFEGSDWKMPMGFTLTERGGNCAPGCHVPMSYDRLER